MIGIMKRLINGQNQKNDMPFNQLPVMYDEGGNIIAQSGAITRYCAKIAKLLPDMPIQCAKTDMIMEQSNDIYDLMVKCKYAGDDEAQTNAWAEFKEKKLHEKLIPLNDLLKDKFYGGIVPNAADICVFSIINLIVRAGIKDCLMNYKKLYDHYTDVYLTGNIKDYIKNQPKVYFVYKEKKSNVLSSPQ
jgi:glutathione S-transferase